MNYLAVAPELRFAELFPHHAGFCGTLLNLYPLCSALYGTLLSRIISVKVFKVVNDFKVLN